MGESGKTLTPLQNTVLAKSPLFADMDESELSSVLPFLDKNEVKKGDDVFREGDTGEFMYILLSGKLSAYVSQPDGTQRPMFEIKPGDFFGEMSIIANEPRSETLTAAEDTEIMALPGIDFYRIVFELPMIGVKMLNAISKVQNNWLDQTSKNLSDLTRWGEAARRRAITDELTGLYNRRFLDDSINDRFEHGSVGIRTMSLLILDLDRIHFINERHGTPAGDHIFMEVADILRSCTRAGDICARFAGDEFAVLLPDTGLEEAVNIAERIRGSVAAKNIMVSKTPETSEKIAINVQTSIGVAVAPIHAGNRDSLFLAADSALRKAKEQGRNRVNIPEAENRE